MAEAKMTVEVSMEPSAQPEKRTEERTETHACDLISRQAAIDHLKKRLYETALNNNTEHPYYEEIADNRVDIWLNELPSAQPEVLACGEGELIAQPEIIRCKDCKYWDRKNICYGYCDSMSVYGCDEEFYCGYAERRTDEVD